MPVYSSRIRSNVESEEKAQPNANTQNTASLPQSANILENIFGKKTPDFERVILVVLIILLAKDGADLTLLIALGYLLI